MKVNIFPDNSLIIIESEVSLVIGVAKGIS